MTRELLRGNLRLPTTRVELVQRYCTGKSVLDIGCVNHNVANTQKDTWIHREIRSVAAEVLGVDYLAAEVDALRQLGYDVIQADVTKPLPLDREFDVVFAGNIIEHLSSFEGFMANVKRHLKPGGVALISTCNPFYREQYFYSAFKNDIIVNEEHTCWICPVTMDHLARRFGMATVAVEWVLEKWRLGDCIFHGPRQELDIFTGLWRFNRPAGLFEKLVAGSLARAAAWTQRARVKRVRARYGDEFGRFFYLFIKCRLVDFFWGGAARLMPHSAVNRYELFVSVLTPNR